MARQTHRASAQFSVSSQLRARRCASRNLFLVVFPKEMQHSSLGNQKDCVNEANMSMMNQVHGFVDDRKESELINIQTVSGTYFQTLGVGPKVGRVINENDDSTEGDHPVLVISHGFWKHRLNGDPAVLDHKLKLGNTIFNIVGVAPAEFFGTKVGEAPRCVGAAFDDGVDSAGLEGPQG